MSSIIGMSSIIRISNEWYKLQTTVVYFEKFTDFLKQSFIDT